MLTKEDFQTVIENSLAKYPSVQALYEAGDPRIRQHLEAMAAMLALFSSQIEVAQTEQFEKARDSTILADAAMRGIVRQGKAARARILATNEGRTPFTVESGRNLIDSSGLIWHVETSVTVEPGGTGTFEATQRNIRTISHTVEGSVPFYAIEIPTAEDDAYLCGIAVSDSNGAYEYRARYVNTAVGDRVYHVEADDRQRVFVRFGYDNVVGVQPADGQVITLQLSYTNGDVQVEYGAPFSFEYTMSAGESVVSLSMEAMLASGESPISMTVLRDLAKYPSVYREEAVFLGEFGFLVRRNFPNLQFLSVWNETMEENARGPNVDNVNALFVACLSPDGTEKTLEEENSEEPITPEEIEEEDLTETQKAIRRVIQNADDSYRVRFFTPIVSKIRMKVSATVSTSYIVSDVKAKIVEAILTEYGKESAASRRGMSNPLYRDVYSLLTAKIAALTDGEADLMVSVDDYSDPMSVRPELWRFVSEESLTVTVTTRNIVRNTWGG